MAARTWRNRAETCDLEGDRKETVGAHTLNWYVGEFVPRRSPNQHCYVDDGTATGQQEAAPALLGQEDQ